MTLTRDNLSIEVAIIVSLLLHAMTFGVYQNRAALSRLWLFKPVARKFAATPAAQKVAPAAPVITFVDAPAPVPEKKTKPHVFIETDEQQPPGEADKNTPFYSDRSTAAANPENPTGKIGETPYLNGREDRMLSTESVPLPRPGAPVPAVPPQPASGGARADTAKAQEPPKAAATERVPPKPEQKVAPPQGLMVIEQYNAEQKLAMAQKQENIRNLARVGPRESAPATPAVPAIPTGGATDRSIAASKSRAVAAGVSRQGVAAFNVAGSPFGAYDKKLIQAVQSRWFALIDRYSVYERAGTVTLYFMLYDDGKVANLRRKENSAGEMLALFCEKAVTDSAPFDALPESLRTLVGKEPREVNFTFYY